MAKKRATRKDPIGIDEDTAARALAERWPLSPAVRRQMLERLLSFAKSPRRKKGQKQIEPASAETVLTAIRTVIQADRVNLQHERLEFAKQQAGLATSVDHDQVDPAAAARALEALNGTGPAAGDPKHPAGDG